MTLAIRVWFFLQYQKFYLVLLSIGSYAMFLNKYGEKTVLCGYLLCGYHYPHHRYQVIRGLRKQSCQGVRGNIFSKKSTHLLFYNNSVRYLSECLQISLLVLTEFKQIINFYSYWNTKKLCGGVQFK